MKRIYFLISSILLFGTIISAQQTIWLENFNTYSNGEFTGKGSPPIASWTADGKTGGRGIDIQSNQLDGRNTRNPNPDRTTWQIDSADPIEINGFSNISISIDISATNNLENNDYIQVQYNLEGSGWFNFSTNGYISGNFASTVASQTGLSGSTLFIRIIIYNNNNNEYHYADNILVTGTPLVPPVADFTADNTVPLIGTTVSFTDLSTEKPNSWSWNISPATFNYVGGTNSSTQNPQVQFNAGGLYTVSLIATNIAGSGSITKTDYIDVFNCSVTSYPYLQTFDSWTQSPNPGNQCTPDGSVTLEECWMNESGDDIDWDIHLGATGSNNTGPTGDHTGGGNYLYTEASGGNGCANSTGYFTTPVLNFSTIDIPVLTFWYHMYGSNMGTMSVQISTDGGSTWSGNIWSLNGNQGNSWYEASVNLSSYAQESNVKLRWTGLTGNNFRSDMAVDDILIDEIPYVAPIADFVADVTTTNLGDVVSFTDLSAQNPTSWSWSFTPSTISYSGSTSSASQNPQVIFNITGLYTVELTATNYAGSDVMTKVDYIFVQDCSVQTFPYSEHFDNGGLIPDCWQNVDNSGNGKLWEFNNPGARVFNSSTSLNGFAIFDSDNYGNNTGVEDADLISPTFNLSGETTVYLQFEHYFYAGFGGAAKLFMSIDGGSNWTQLDSWNTSTANPTTELYNLSASAAGYSQVIFKWNWTGDWSWYWAIDDIALINQQISTGLWTGAVSSDWSNTSNWDDNTIPNAFSNITIPSGVPNFPAIDEVASCKNLNINDGAELSIITGGQLDISGSLNNGEGASGHFQMDDGTCNIAENYYSEIGSTTDINNGTWSFYNWYQNTGAVWSKGTIALSGGTINATGSVVWSAFDVNGTMDGPVTINIGGTFRNDETNWSMTNGTINMLGTDGSGPFYIMSSAWGTGLKAKTYNLNINGPGSEFITNPPTDITGLRVLGNLNVIAGFLNTEGGAGFMNDDNFVAGNLIIGAAGEVTANVSGSFNVLGDANLLADPSSQASFIDNGNTQVIGAANVQQYLSSERWHLVSPPVTGATIYTYLNIYLKSYNESNDSWNYLVQPTSLPMDVNQGFSAWASDALTGPTTVTYTGVLNTGDQSIPAMSYTPASPSVGWNLVGNPFPSGINWNSNWSKSNLSEWACIHNSGNDGCYNASTGTEWPNVGDLPNGSLPPTQGFWVRATSTAAAISIPNSERVHASQAIYKQSLIDIPQALRLRVDGNNDFDVVLIQFSPEATQGFDQNFDLEKRWGYTESPQIYSIKTDNLYSVDVLPEVNKELVLPIGFEVGVDGNYEIEATELYGFNADITVILEDIKDGVFKTLSANTIYEFTAAADDETHRFNLHFKDVTSGLVSTDAKGVYIYSYEDNVYIQTPDGKLQHVVIYDLMGHEVISKGGFNGDINKIDLGGNKGYYIVKAQTENQVYSSKVFIK